MTAPRPDASTDAVGAEVRNATELTTARVLYRAAIFTIAMVALALLLLQLKFVIIQVFAALIVAAGMAPLVARATDPNRAHIFGWRPPKAAVVVLIYLVIGVLLIIIGSIMIGNAVDGLDTLVALAPVYASTIDAWLASLQAASPLLAEMHLIDLFGGTTGISQTLSSVLERVLGAASLLLTLFGGVVNVLFGVRLTDTQAGFRAVRATAGLPCPISATGSRGS